LYLYGSTRLGYITLEREIQNPTSLAPGLPAPGSQFFSVSGLKNYELTNHWARFLSGGILLAGCIGLGVVAKLKKKLIRGKTRSVSTK
jgi:hypothetical protein